jgi:hypothetical protein
VSWHYTSPLGQGGKGEQIIYCSQGTDVQELVLEKSRPVCKAECGIMVAFKLSLPTSYNIKGGSTHGQAVCHRNSGVKLH